jgi:glycosyltransferase involved in cell wall biosynthesis
VVWGLHDLLTLDHFSQMHIRLDVALANRFAARVIANSTASAEAFIAQGGRREMVHVVHNGISASQFDAVTETEVADLRHELGLNGSTVVGVFSRLSNWKGQHVALDALRHLPEVRLLLVGGALFGEQEYECALRAQAARLGLTSRVRFLGFRSDIPRLMRLADVILHTSTAPEPFGRVIVEGMLARRPVVAARAGAVGEIVEDGITGLLVPPGDSRALASAIQQLLSDPVGAEQIARAGRASAETRFAVDTMVNAQSRVIEEVTFARTSRISSDALSHG